MHKAFLFLIVYLTILSTFSMGQPDFVWAQRAGGLFDTPNTFDIGCGVTVDHLGNTYVTGYFFHRGSFGGTWLTSHGLHDIFIAKLDPSGNFLWAKNAGGAGDDYGKGIVADSQGNVYITGSFWQYASFGNLELSAYAARDIFITKLDTDGNFIWAKRAGGSNLNRGQSIAIDDDDNIYITGNFRGNASFGPIMLSSAGQDDVFAAKLDTNGNFIWAKSFGGPGNDLATGITSDPQAGIYISGVFEDTSNFDSIEIESQGMFDVFISKLDKNGNVAWATSAGGSANERVPSVAVDSAGGVYITGSFENNAYFGHIELISHGSSDIFIAKLNNNGSFLWADHAGGILGDAGHSITVDFQDNIYFTGKFFQTATFGEIEVTSSNCADLFICKIDTNGNFEWVQTAGGIGSTVPMSISVDSSGFAYLTGSFYNTASFGNHDITSIGGGDIFITKFGQRGDGPDASIQSQDISLVPPSAEPGDTIEINARIYNMGNESINSGNANFYWSIIPGIDLQYIDHAAFYSLAPYEYSDIIINWHTDNTMEATEYIITVTLTDILPYDSDLANNTAFTELFLPVELAYFKAEAHANTVNIEWMTISEIDNLGFNLFRMNTTKLSRLLSHVPLKLNETIIPGQGTSSGPRVYSFDDILDNNGIIIYILESVSVQGETELFYTRLERVF